MKAVVRAAAGPWRAAALLTSPHKLCFFWAGVLWALAAAWWTAHQLAQAAGRGWPWQVPATTAHGLWFSLGWMPLFIAGFMFTAGPKWLRRPPVDARFLRFGVALFVAGWMFAAAGFHRSALLAAAGLGVATLGWGLLAHRMVRLVRRSSEPDRRHAKAVAAAAVALAACLAAAALALGLQRPQALAVIARLGLWCIVLVFVVVSHRMLPFLGDGAWPRLDARWPGWPLWLVASVPVVQGAAALAQPWFAAASGWRWAVAIHLALATVLSLRLSLRWLGTPPARQPFVRMLLLALLWWNLALGLAAIAWLPVIGAGVAAGLGSAALHALALGFMGGTLLAMVTRISSTHSGRAQAVDRVARVLHAALQVAALARVAAALWPAPADFLLPAAALAWLAVAAAWALRHGRWLGQPRVDGREAPRKQETPGE